MDPWIRVLILSLGGALGVNARYWLGVWMSCWVSPQFPWATFSINVSGSFAIGFLSTAMAHWLPHPHIRLLVVVGFLGGYTTFSTFAFDSLTLWENGERAHSLVNAVGSVAAGLVAVALGVTLARVLVERNFGPIREAAMAEPAKRPQAEDARKVPGGTTIPSRASLLRFSVNTALRWHGKPLYQAVVERARAGGMTGASVFRVELSYGASERLHDERNDYLSADIPVVIEIVDDPAKVAALFDDLGAMDGAELAAIRPVHVHRYGHPEDAQGENRSAAGAAQPGGSKPMPIEGAARRVTIYIGSSDTWKGGNLAVAIVERCRALGMAGATVTRGVMGFGKQSLIHRAHVLGLSDDLPERVEVVDRPERIAQFLPVLDEMVGGGLIVLEDVQVVRYLHHPNPPGAQPHSRNG